jgi:hypothetical protein
MIFARGLLKLVASAAVYWLICAQGFGRYVA